MRLFRLTLLVKLVELFDLRVSLLQLLLLLFDLFVTFEHLCLKLRNMLVFKHKVADESLFLF
jgi:hypothetical protein